MAERAIDPASGREGGCFPTPAQALLLEAGLAAGPAAARAFKTWADGGWIDRLDEGSFRLLPLVYRNLHANGVQHPLLPTLRGIHRRAWCKNQLLWSELPPILQTFADQKIPTMVLKGPALALRHYRDAGARPTRDLDIAVPEAHVERAFAMLTEDGWTPISWMPPRFDRDFRGLRHAVGLRNRAGKELDLHWHILWQCCAPGADDQFWQRAVAFDMAGTETRVLDPTDQLLHACAHGMIYNLVPPVRWIADAVVITRAGEIDWTRLTRDIRTRRLALLCRTALQYLRDHFALAVPAAVLAELHATHISRGEAAEFVRLTDPHRLLGSADTIRAVWHQCGRSAPGGPWSRARGFARFQQYQWFEPTLGSAARTAILWACRRALGTRATDAMAGPSPVGVVK